MKILGVFLVLGCLIPTVSAEKTKFVVIAKGVIDLPDASITRLSLVAKVNRDGDVFTGTARLKFVLPDGTKITYRKQEISFTPISDELIICNCDILGEIPIPYYEGYGWISSTPIIIGTHTGTLNCVWRLKNTIIAGY
jgi:hypothetical protein